MSVFMATLSQMTFLFLLIAIGFLLTRLNILDKAAATTLSKLENNIFIPALVLNTFMQNFSIEKLNVAKTVFLVSFVIVLIVMPLAVGISKLCTKDKYIQKIYTYGLAFSNFGFMGNAVVNAVFPDIFVEYLVFTLPLWTMIYLWGAPVLLLSEDSQKQGVKERAKAFVNPMFICMIVGMVFGLTNISLPGWFASCVSSCADCMSPIAMLLTGITVATIDLRKIFTNTNIYVVSVIRLILIPITMLVVLRLIGVSDTVMICAVCSVAMPLGLNTIVIPSAYGKDTTVAAGMAVLSHILSCITIPLVFAMMMQIL